MALQDLSEVRLKSSKLVNNKKLGKAKMPTPQSRVPDLKVCSAENHAQVWGWLDRAEAEAGFVLPRQAQKQVCGYHGSCGCITRTRP